MNMKQYLQSSSIIDWTHCSVQRKAKELASDIHDEIHLTKICFEFVRDSIFHSVDFMKNPVTLKASEVLKHKTGFCFAKSHLLAALLRAHSIPSGFCYQRLLFQDHYSLHGLVAVYLKPFGWLRLDPRGNNKNIQVEFNPPEDGLAFKANAPGEADFSEIWDEPLPIVIEFLTKHKNVEESLRHLPDIDILKLD